MSSYSLSSHQEIEKMIVITFDVELNLIYLPQLMMNIFSSSSDIFKQLSQFFNMKFAETGSYD